jgi:adenylosuccinate synthase
LPVFEDTVKFRGFAWILSIGLLLAIHANAQTRSRPINPASQGSAPEGSGDQVQDRMAREMAKKANLERQAALKSDTDKLFRLAEELKNSVDKSNANVLSLEVVKKAEEIEKLAHSVKDKMRGPN